MDKRERKHSSRLIEWGKDVLIVLLTCSAVYLGADALVVGGLGALLPAKDQAFSNVTTQKDTSGVAWPVRMAVTGWSSGSRMRYGVQYDQEACDVQFQEAASLLMEALSSPGAAQKIPEREWHRVLSETSNLYFDLLGNVPLSVLSGWLSGTEHPIDATARRLALSAEKNRVRLYYQNVDDGFYYMRDIEVVSAEQVAALTDTVMGNAAAFAFEVEGMENLRGETLLLTQQPRPRSYSASNPMTGELQSGYVRAGSNLSRLMQALSFPDSSYIYPGTDQVIRSGNDTLRISADGVVRYNVAEGEISRYIVEHAGERPTAFEAAEACRILADGVVGELAGAARLYLKQVHQTQNGWQVDFGYCLDGANVQVGESGVAAHFVIVGNEITQFVLQLRCYTEAGQSSVILPEKQAAAALEALDESGSELILSYLDTGGEAVSAVWTAQ